MKYDIHTEVADLIITSAVDLTGCDLYDRTETVMRRVINTQEEQIRQALIQLGWTPPAPRIVDEFQPFTQAREL